MIAALFVATGGVYFGRPDVDPWDESRDARLYRGPHPVVAHPPCERWGRYWSGGPSAKVRRRLGDDGGCFAFALEAVRRYGGVLEHPEASHAWRVFGLERPPRSGGWVQADPWGGWTCCVEQGHYGHAARKATWLYAVTDEFSLPTLTWGPCGTKGRLEPGFHSKEERTAASPERRLVKRLNEDQRVGTPPAFAEVLIGIAKNAQPGLTVSEPKRYRCIECGAAWKRHRDTSWSLWSSDDKPGACCDNATEDQFRRVVQPVVNEGDTHEG